MRLIPGVAVSSSVLATIDTRNEGVISESEQRTYAEQVLRNVSLSVDSNHLTPRLVSVTFPTVDQIKEGTGEIQIESSADLPPASDINRKLVFENHHQQRISAYLVNCLVPQDRRLRVVSQIRNQNQSLYQLNYVQEGAGLNARGSDSSSRSGGSSDRVVLLALVGVAILCGKQFVNAQSQ